MKTTTTRFLLTATLSILALSARAAVVGEVRLVPALPAALGASAAAASVSALSATSLSAPSLSAPSLAAPSLSLPAAQAPISGPKRLPGVSSPIPVPQPLEVSDESYLDWSFLDGPDASPALVLAPRGPKNLPPAGAAEQLKFASLAAKKPSVTIGADATFDASRARVRLLVPAE